MLLAHILPCDVEMGIVTTLSVVLPAMYTALVLRARRFFGGGK